MDEFSTKHRHHYSEQVLFWGYIALILSFMLIVAAVTGIGLMITVIAMIVLVAFLAIVGNNWDYVK